MNDYRCRVSEENARDPYFDGMTETEEAIEAEMEAEDAQSRRDEFKDLLSGLVVNTSKMLTRPHWSPDEDDIEMLLTIHDELAFYLTHAEIRESKIADDARLEASQK